jgi:succinate dehydrogenase flavin-adding protein (antitoxin of CptAB toxin-antitoxin module)
MSRYLTIAISEKERNKDKFKIIYYDLSKEVFAEADKKTKDFFDSDGNPVWDLFHVTEEKQNSAKIIESYSKQQIINLFESNLTSLERFFLSSQDYGIVKLNSIKAVHPLNEKFQTHVVVRSRGQDKPLLNKDYRWLKYWKSISDKMYDEKCQQWKDFLNSSDNKVYAVMYRHTFPTGRKGRWIAGFHCIKGD